MPKVSSDLTNLSAGPPSFIYTVSVTLSREMVADYTSWLIGRESDGHVADVVRAGALDAEVLQIDTDPDQPARVEVRYRFANREALETYLSKHAPRLRAEGLARFPEGLSFQRSTGPVLALVRHP
jgi:Domain of unknown function (DUF4286)